MSLRMTFNKLVYVAIFESNYESNEAEKLNKCKLKNIDLYEDVI